MKGAAPMPESMLGIMPPPRPASIPGTLIPIDPKPIAFAPVADKASFCISNTKRFAYSQSRANMPDRDQSINYRSPIYKFSSSSHNLPKEYEKVVLFVNKSGCQLRGNA
jgi:hypothetical protein